MASDGRSAGSRSALVAFFVRSALAAAAAILISPALLTSAAGGGGATKGATTGAAALGDMSTAQKAGISVGSVLGAALVLFLLHLLPRQSRRRGRSSVKVLTCQITGRLVLSFEAGHVLSCSWNSLRYSLVATNDDESSRVGPESRCSRLQSLIVRTALVCTAAQRSTPLWS
mmetsp:Transcript_17420/g.55519  ORF Transcript_17420/g.55519 Transcript_17420/m.55519 type:complete len:172 (+) Transcript_17420:739-1254(+)